jgi:hypothetical protein
MDTKDVIRRTVLLIGLVMVAGVANARGGMNHGETGGGLGLVIAGTLGAILSVAYISGRIEEWLYRRQRAKDGSPIPPRAHWAKLGRCPICGEIMKLKLIKQGRKEKIPPKVVYNCLRNPKCLGYRLD